MDNYTPNPFITQPIYDPTRPIATPTQDTSNNGKIQGVFPFPISSQIVG